MLISSNPLLCAGSPTSSPGCQSHIQPGLECLQGWGIHSLLGQPVQCVTTLFASPSVPDRCWLCISFIQEVTNTPLGSGSPTSTADQAVSLSLTPYFGFVCKGNTAAGSKLLLGNSALFPHIPSLLRNEWGLIQA